MVNISYKEILALKEEILKHKWYESERKGYDKDTVKTVSIGLADGKQWMEMLERGKSVLDGLVR